MAGTKLVIVTGLSGAGKSTAIRCFEEMGYFTVDNLPPSLLPTFVDLCAQRETPLEHLAVVTDVRGGAFFDSMSEALAQLEAEQVSFRILYLEADPDVLVSRFKESRFPHPLQDRCQNLTECIELEQGLLRELRERASVVLDTTDESVRQLRGEITRLFPREEQTTRTVHVVAFGYKYGVPPDVDYLFDVRYLRNPHHDPELRPFTGEDARVREFVESDPATGELCRRLFDFLDFVLPRHWDEGRHYVSIGVGCTGGKHRSVVLAHDLARHCEALGCRALVQQRDLGRE